MYGNKGEWSEIYVFLSLLSEGKLYLANDKLEKDFNAYFSITKVIREEIKGEIIEYVVDKAVNEEISVYYNNEKQKQIPQSVFNEKATTLYKSIVSNNGSFEIKELSEFLSGIGINKIKAPSSDKTDIRVEIRDIHTSFIRNLGFSIKSDVGHAPTLVNAGKTTNFSYKVNGLTREQIEEINKIDTANKIKDRLAMIKEYGGSLEFFEVCNKTFRSNLIMIDSRLPEIIGEILLYYYMGSQKKCSDVVKEVSVLNPIGYESEKMYEYKVKKLLCSCALGMKPATLWDGYDEANGGYIIVKKDGEIVAYHIYNRNDFEDYLFNNTIFEKASTSRHDYLSIYENKDGFYINLNLQIRFI